MEASVGASVGGSVGVPASASCGTLLGVGRGVGGRTGWRLVHRWISVGAVVVPHAGTTELELPAPTSMSQTRRPGTGCELCRRSSPRWAPSAGASVPPTSPTSPRPAACCLTETLPTLPTLPTPACLPACLSPTVTGPCALDSRSRPNEGRP